MIAMNLTQEYKKSLKMLEVEEVFDLIFYRPLAFIFVKTIYRTSITPNQVTWLALLFGVLGAFLITFGTHQVYILAALCFIIYNVLDCSDGQLARINKSGTLTGRIVDGFADYVVAVVSYIGIGIGYANHTDNPIFNWILVALAGFSNAAHSLTLDYYRNQFMDYTLNRKSILGEDLIQYEEEYNLLKKDKRRTLDRMLIWFYLKYSYLQINFSTNKINIQTKYFDAREYYAKNKLMIHLWTYIGPTTELTFMIVCAFINRWDIFLWGMLVFANTYALILYMIQRRINTSLKIVGNQ